MEGNPHYLLTSAGDVENLNIRKVNYAKQWKQSAEVVEPKDTIKKVCMRKSTHLVGVPSSSSDSVPDYFDEFGEPVYGQTHLVHAKEIHKKKHLIQFLISVNLEKVRKLAEGPCPTVLLKADTEAGCQSSKLHYIQQNNRQQINPTAINLQNGSIWKFHCRHTWKILCIAEMEGQDLQAIILHDNSQCITQSTFQRCLLHPRSAETMLLSGNFENLKEFQYTSYNQLGVTPDAWQIISSLVR